jgi:hypothetical protein
LENSPFYPQQPPHHNVVWWLIQKAKVLLRYHQTEDKPREKGRSGTYKISMPCSSTVVNVSSTFPSSIIKLKKNIPVVSGAGSRKYL